ncbi:MAG: DUF2974 domain-containing protein [Clostridiaceae bacterium]
MGNMIDYVIETKDMTFEDKGFNTIDALIFSQFVNLPLKDIVSDDLIEYPFYEVIENLLKKDRPSEAYFIVNISNIRMMKELLKSIRYKDVLVSSYRERKDSDLVCQFGGMAFHYGDEETFIAFRGTDSTYLGWKESLELSFKDRIPSQVEGVKYINEYAPSFRKNIKIGGHSKGGNIAIYAGVLSDAIFKDRINFIYSFDGPGFREETGISGKVLDEKDKIMTYIPQSSIVGILLEHAEPETVIKSSALAMLQHDPYSWVVKDDDFEVLKELSYAGKAFAGMSEELLLKLDKESLKVFLTLAYEIIESPSKAKEDNLIAKVIAFTDSVNGINDDEKNVISNVINGLKDAVFSQFK